MISHKVFSILKNFKDIILGFSCVLQESGEIGMELYPTGSSLPDCSHACGPCTPCRRVMVSFNRCSVESCPIVYRCMCKGKYYHVPSN
ncbi:Membrane lipoprotein [Dorcoceras hygrometricum]|uniref:Epidermal patterning factor-like protein n=2 Tax=Dorcoceras hygrometricum TaxID=472368 RepID=A0A2Z7BAI3_9LAMI|nr:Membrane lipoprotein [Dorcoceras hygrometricum]